jgi:hypothetical protein
MKKTKEIRITGLRRHFPESIVDRTPRKVNNLLIRVSQQRVGQKITANFEWS